ncbi:transposon Tn7 transposition protein TnsC [Denitrovibrio acetiphilus DSM 12809]|uniref:Transposon Tn7 transposition protein TnsC n=1 Tax=Denitrovibrio acetiphilus (strain DSM 12809 / NBRC 114555 / N2460) TaxID=522772 RepID=D4H2J2_DENA2|nr:ATP-binding protein [Denitrovibrio acetiphilus]ADD67053.1 transposon Tn7 transposition protein TnsC [Denitrovibrio acetiphilus DSM 12809]
MIKFKKAKYKKQIPTQYRGNPLIEALPPIKDGDTLTLEMLKEPYYKKDEINQPPEIKQYSLNKIFAYFHPLDMHIEYAYKIDMMIREGYVGRNPREKINPALSAENPLDNSTDYDSVRSTAFVGISGIGKTTATKRILGLYDQVILHDRPDNCLQVVWLKIECPHDGSLKQLCISFFLEMDKILKTDYHAKYAKPRNSIEEMLAMMTKVASIHHLGILIIDEIQNLSEAKSGGAEKMLNFFVSLNNTISVPTLLIGTLKAKKLFQKDLRQGRRLDGKGGMVWERLEYDELWDVFVEGFWEYCWVKNQPELTEDILETLYKESQGIIDAAMKIYALAQHSAIMDGSETITKESIKIAAKKGLVYMRPMLDALKSGNIEEIIQYSDIIPMSFDEIKSKYFSTTAILRRNIKQEENEKAEFDEKVYKAINSLVADGIDYDLAEPVVEEIAKKNPRLIATELSYKALSRINKKTKKPDKTTYSEDIIQLSLYKEAKESERTVYSLFTENGITLNPLGDFKLGKDA